MKNILIALNLLVAIQAVAATNELTVYSAYEGARLAPIFKPFTDRTGISVKVEFAPSAELINRLVKEGASTTADLYLDKDVIYLSEAQRQNVLQGFNSSFIDKTVPAQFIDSEKNWFLILYRARTIMYNSTKVSPSELSTYQALGDTKWKNRLCLRTSANTYNQALAASMISHDGIEKTIQTFKNWVANFSMDPIKGDTDLLKAIAEGKCDVGVANTYYLPPLIKADKNFPVRPFFPNQDSTGAHVNGVGMGLAKHSKNISEATLLLEYMISEEVQTAVAGGFFHYPVNKDAILVKELVDFGSFKPDSINMGIIGIVAPAASAVFEAASYK